MMMMSGSSSAWPGRSRLFIEEKYKVCVTRGNILITSLPWMSMMMMTITMRMIKMRSIIYIGHILVIFQTSFRRTNDFQVQPEIFAHDRVVLHKLHQYKVWLGLSWLFLPKYEDWV